MNEIEKVLTKFANRVVRTAKLHKKVRGTKLKDSIRHELDVFPNSFTLEFFMNEYGLFQDKGVSGTHIKYLTKYSYTTKQPPRQAQLFVELTAEESVVNESLRDQGQSLLDDIAMGCRLPTFKIASLLLNLELKGRVRPLPGKLFEAI